jgi:hypothetical protein
MMMTMTQMVYLYLQPCAQQNLSVAFDNFSILRRWPSSSFDSRVVSSLFAEDDPDDVDFEPDSETDKAAVKVIYQLEFSLSHDV